MVSYGGSEIFGKELNKFQMWMEPIALLPQIVQCCHLHQYFMIIKSHACPMTLKIIVRTLTCGYEH